MNSLCASCLIGVSLLAPITSRAQTNAATALLEVIRVSDDKRHFVCRGSGKRFTPWGFNYDHDRANRLLETYWAREWSTVESDFDEMKQLGANVVRIHLQVSRFMKSAKEANGDSLAQLARLVTLAERTGLYLDVTGLGCYDKKDVPRWYNRLKEAERWEVQARFWEAVAATCSKSPAVFCYDLMNEPLLSEDKKRRDWTPGAFGERYFMQRLTVDYGGRTAEQVANAWVSKMVAAVRAHDGQHLITIGAIPWALTWPNAKPGIEANTNLDFLSLHFYPKSGEIDKALKALAVYDVGRPIIIEEMFPLSCSTAELGQFVDGSRPGATGWMGFYWGKTIGEYKQKREGIAEGMTLDWLEYFARKSSEMK